MINDEYVIKLKDYDIYFSREHFMSLLGREIKVLELRFALNGHEKLSCEKIGHLIENYLNEGKPVNRERVRQIQENALRKLRRKNRHNKIILHHRI